MSTITLFAFRALQGWRLTRRSDAPIHTHLTISDLIVYTAFVAAMLMFGRNAATFAEVELASYLLPIAMISAVFCVASLVAVAPAVWIFFRAQQRRVMKLIALIAIDCVLVGVIFVKLDQLNGPQSPAHVTFALTVLWVLVAFGYFIFALALLRMAGFRLRTRHDASAVYVAQPESALRRWAAPVGVIAWIASVQLVFTAVSSYQDFQDSKGRRLQREMFARGGQAELDESDDVMGIILGPDATRDEIRSLSDYPNLQSVKFAGTKFEDQDVQLLWPLRKLQLLDLSGTSITDIGLEEISGWPKVLSISVAGTKCTAAGLRKFVERHPLYKLDIGYLKLTDAEVISIATAITPHIPINDGPGKVAPRILLGLAGNPITNSALTFLSNSEHLWGLDLKDCKVDADGFINTAFVGLNLDGTSIGSTFADPSKKLRVYDTLSMDRTEITDAVLPNLFSGHLRHLKLGETQITEQGLSGLGLDCLTELSLNSRNFTGSCFETWKPNLDVLNMSHSGVSDAMIKEIVMLPQLHSLSLSDTAVTGGCLEALSQSTLIYISLSGTRVTAAGLLTQDWGNKTISIAADQFTEPEFKMLLKHGQFTVMPPMRKF